jgi:hypothetical protein
MMKTLTAEEILALKPGMLIQSTDPQSVSSEGRAWVWLVISAPIDAVDGLYDVLEPMWHTPFLTDWSFATADDMVEEGMIRIA